MSLEQKCDSVLFSTSRLWPFIVGLNLGVEKEALRSNSVRQAGVGHHGTRAGSLSRVCVSFTLLHLHHHQPRLATPLHEAGLAGHARRLTDLVPPWENTQCTQCIRT